MIISRLQDLENQAPHTPAFVKAIEFLFRQDIHKLPNGKFEIDAERVFAIIDRYQTVETASPRFEYHRDYIDIQYIVAGHEVIGWVPAERIAVTEPYTADKDIAFGTVMQDDWSPLLLKAGEAAVFWPEDGHAPRLAAQKAASVMKIVIKIRTGA